MSVRKVATQLKEVKEPKITIINADLLIPGDGEPLKDTTLVISDKTIVYVGSPEGVPKKYLRSGRLTRHHVPVLMPGLWDAHIHFGGNDEFYFDYTDFLATHPASAGARLARECWEALQRGYTSVRDVAGYGCEISKAVVDGSIVGPNIYGCGGALSQTAGHGDIFGLPASDVYGHYSVNSQPFEAGPLAIVDGVDEARRAVRLQIRRGAKVIKLMASGGVMSRDDNPKYAQFSPEELKVIVEEAERQGRIVAAHCHGKAGIMAAIEAGCKTLEHVSYADEEVFALMKEKGVAYVATRHVIDMVLDTGGVGVVPESWAKMKALAGSHLEAYQGAVRAGVTMIMGIDGPAGWNSAAELQAAVQIGGMTSLEAIKAATANGPLCVGSEMAPLTGQLKEGYEADVIALEENPIADITVLQDKKVITHVWKTGKLYKGPGVGPWGEE
jgi:imidazolonepropionase-like amidohydrolase